MRGIYKYLIVILLVLLQSSFFRFVDILGVKPDVVFIFVFSLSLLNGPWEAIYLSLFAGLLQDIMFNRALGIYTFALLLVSYIAGLLNKNIFRESTFVAFVFTFIGTLFYNLIIMFSMVLMKYQFGFIEEFLNVGMIQAVYNSLIVVFVYKYIVNFNSYVSEKKTLFSRKSRF
ncbi:MAG: rod shape-determining protein MreD [Caldanaerobacter sp.]|uniref:rod shape-determining protein MreD n=1 Tax=Caldanaerobacter sp. TaxID=2930036 RepID=UPI003C75BC4C